MKIYNFNIYIRKKYCGNERKKNEKIYFYNNWMIQIKTVKQEKCFISVIIEQ